jgi:GT2 family glycosyltransferase
MDERSHEKASSVMKICHPADDSPLAADSRVGVVIPVYNRRTILLETLPYVLNQSLPPARLVIVDDGSTDGTPTAVEAWLARRRPAIAWEVIRQRRSTAADARNIGFEQVRDLPLVAFLDSDDHWPADFLTRGAAALEANPHAVAAIADRRFLDSGGELLEEDDCRALVRNPIEWFFQNGAGVASCSLLRTAAVEAAGAWPSEFDAAEDAVLFCQMALAGPWTHLPGAPVEFHVGSAQARREEHNLSRRNPDSHRRWATTFEGIYARIDRDYPSTPRGELHRSLAQRWYWAGKQLFALGRADEARDCFRRALTWQPTLLRAWRRLAANSAARWAGAFATGKRPPESRRLAG